MGFIDRPELRLSRPHIIGALNHVWPGYEEHDGKIWREWQQSKGQPTLLHTRLFDLRHRAGQYFVTREGIRLVTGEYPQEGKVALPYNLKSGYRWHNNFTWQGKEFSADEGIPLNGPLAYQREKIEGMDSDSPESGLERLVFNTLQAAVVRTTTLYDNDYLRARGYLEAFFISANPGRHVETFRNFVLGRNMIEGRVELTVPNH